MGEDIIGIGKKGLVVRVTTLWTKTSIKILAYFVKNNNFPSTYTEISRAYISSSRSNYQKACNELVKRGYLEKLDNGLFKVRKERWEQVKIGEDTINIKFKLPNFNKYLKKVKKINKMPNRQKNKRTN